MMMPLLATAAVPAPTATMNRFEPEGPFPPPANPPSGCNFHTRCAHCTQRCKEEAPVQREVEPGHFVVCHLYDM